MTTPTPVPPSAAVPMSFDGPDIGVEFIAPPPGPPPLPPFAGDGFDPAPEPARARRRIRLVPRSLSSKLVAGVVTLVIAVVLATGVCTYYALRSFLLNRLDQQLNSSVAGELEVNQLFNPSPTGGLHAPQTVWAIALSTSGAVALSPQTGSFVQSMALSASQRAALAHRTTESPTSLTTVDGYRLRVTVRDLQLVSTNQATGAQTTTPITVVIGLSENEVDRTLARLVLLELIIGGTAVVLALVLTSYGVSVSLRNLYRVTDTATDVAAELSPDGAGLDRRVPVVEEGTEVGQLAESMNTLLSAVETQFAARVESENRMRQFLADASHELRTPLTSIRGFAELARMQRAAGSTDADNLDRIESEGTRMSRLVEDLLMLARGAEDSIPRVELVDAADLIDDAVAGARAASPDRRVDVDPLPSYNVVGDPDQLVRVIRNLLTNAVVHTPSESPIRVRSFIDGPGIAIQVVDGGPGLPPEEAAHVFERFWRADKARTRARGGSGLGLSIVASIVQAHHGAAHFQSTVEGGSTVTVWLPGVAG